MIMKNLNDILTIITLIIMIIFTIKIFISLSFDLNQELSKGSKIELLSKYYENEDK